MPNFQTYCPQLQDWGGGANKRRDLHKYKCLHFPVSTVYFSEELAFTD
jgi:hypothetical protein